MKHPVIVGLQYGDEGKGKITDFLAKQADWVIRFNGGNNAGHTLWLNGKKLVTHSVPSGVLYPHVKNYIGAGCVIDPVAFANELTELAAAGATLGPDRLRIDHRAHLTLPLHLALDSGREGGAHGIGTTKRGIGPTYTTKMDRLGVRAGEAGTQEARDRVKVMCQVFNPILKSVGLPESSVEDNLKILEMAAELLRDRVSRDVAPFFDLAKTSRCVLEGAQGILLDLDHGSYPYVTSSNTLAGHSAAGTPFPMSRLGKVIGVAKAYLTRVGQGPFPTELLEETGERIRKRGGEFGATTGRPRRVGWLNLDELRDAVRLSDVSCIVLTKGDILTGESRVMAQVAGRMETFEGWDSMVDAADKTRLNAKLERFVSAIEAHVGIPVVAVGTGADRADIVWRHGQPEFWS